MRNMFEAGIGVGVWLAITIGLFTQGETRFGILYALSGVMGFCSAMLLMQSTKKKKEGDVSGKEKR